MNWEAIGAIGEIVGAFAVVLSLVYLAIQIRQSAKVAAIQASQHVLEGSARFQTRIAEDAELQRIFSAGSKSYDSLERQDRRVFYALVGEFLQRYDVQTQMHAAGMLNDDTFSAATRGVVRLLQNPGVRAVAEIAISHDVPSQRFKGVIVDLINEAERDA